MKEVFVQYASYSSWANQLLLDLINALPEEMHHRQVKSSFKSLYSTAFHQWTAEAIWWQRLKLQERIVVPEEKAGGSMKELSAQLLQQNRLWHEWISNANEHQLHHEFKYQNSKRESFKQPVYQMLLHLFNHGTYHRGQLVTILRTMDIEKIPQTDFIVWSRKK